MRAKPEPWVLEPTEVGVPAGKENSQSRVLRGSRGQGQRLDSGLQEKPRPRASRGDVPPCMRKEVL